MKQIFVAFLILGMVLFACQPQPPQEEVSYISIDDLLAEQNVSNEVTEDSQIPGAIEQPSNENPTTEQPTQPELIELPEDFSADLIEPEIAQPVIPKVTVTEGEKVSFPKLKVTDPDGDPISYTFTAPLNEKGIWNTKEGDAGEYTITITASDGESTVSQKVKVLVLSLNKPPVISNVPDQITLKEGEHIELNPEFSDPDGDKLTITYSGYLDKPIMTVNYDSAGEHSATITASDGKTSTEHKIKIMIKNVNRPPRLEPINRITATEGEKVIVGVKAEDPDGDEVSVNFDAPLNSDGTWQTKVGDAGEFNIKVTASDGELTDSQFARVMISSLNQPPILEALADITIKEGESVKLTPVASDPDGDKVEITYSGWMTGPERTTDFKDAGRYTVAVTASDGKTEVSREVKIVVENVNRPPVFVDII